MIKIKKFTFNPFQENTYLLINENNECIIIDPGCFNTQEETELADFIDGEQLKPTYLINTHCHIDHVLGNYFVAKKYNLELTVYNSSYNMLDLAIKSAQVYGIPYTPSPTPKHFLKEGDIFTFGKNELEVLFIPGHSPDHIVLFCKAENILIGGDVLFKQSIGRTDLPGGNHEELITNIKNKLLVLNENVIVYPGHGPETTIGEEKKLNPFF